ncbi:2-amino-4-hydroxy-6-hydroxymethyldihydropteridine diphosphokinase [Photobacterium sp. 1_MG-2023]|uniref:2-amino-4-hydroxy-6- hydroxymethyldihydropteridine diphosphokinase n=1 Tax=Photobacterium sp. 1_MG-2023 TaxID=3062646 RepID=UPI0026E479B8|nr:2-amino-4-hydroxy-6-hydroxymethyldihydropteridine diphosphokinase [Photobacterium sp. 1_MG-2023]MDO6704908.1 2-amino-4-hydroxy-6-hydroxymethyldihydropteridine diphosphokinase [Photobacterium sp. 1_MG-2023]
MTEVYISIGSNLDREYSVRAAIAELKQLGAEFRLSQIFEAEPVGFDGPSFLNCVVAFKTQLSPDALQAQLKTLERQYGRLPDAPKHQSRTLDLDLLLYGDLIRTDAPVLPRDDIYKFAFVLQPLMELCPEQVIPGDGRTVAEIWREFEHPQVLRPVVIKI